ncbi:Signal peptidase complex subunit 3, partial [Phytophthora megakarya]
MYSIGPRANAAFFTSLKALAIICTLTAISTFLYESAPVAGGHEAALLRSYSGKADPAMLLFDLDAAASQLQFEDEGVTYFLADQHDGLRVTNVTLPLEWDIMPVCDRLVAHMSDIKANFELPD